MSLSPPCLHPLVLISGLATCDFAGTGIADRRDEQDQQFKITLIPAFDLNMNDRSVGSCSLNIIHKVQVASGGMSHP